ncbi:hypothetical protein LX36DRAFT_651739 [Colletotrichum falcatum]|nr:hypothetical protein LX36DRAFT_651739 [Colletotrichum falcatum]
MKPPVHPLGVLWRAGRWMMGSDSLPSVGSDGQTTGWGLGANALTIEHEWEEVQQANQYEQPYFFVSQLFQRDWQPQMWAY